MSLIDEGANLESLRQTAAIPALPEFKPQEERSAWNIVHTAPRAALYQLAADVGEAAVGVKRTLNQMNAQTTEQARKSVGVDFNGKNFMSDAFRSKVEEIRPDPRTAHEAEQLVFDVGRVVGKAVGLGLTTGPAAIPLLAGSEGFAETDKLQRQGVDNATARSVGAAAALATGVGAVVPVAPLAKGFTKTNIAQVVGLAGISGPATFMAQQQQSRDILERANYGEIAKQYDPLDPLGLTVSMAAPLFFGGFALRGGKPQPKGGKAGEPAPEQPKQPQATQDQIDAAMVQNLSTMAATTDATQFWASKMVVRDKITAELDSLGKFTHEENQTSATIKASMLARIAHHEGITPEQAHEKYGATIRDVDVGGLNQGRDLLVQHNLSEENLNHALRMGGIPVPSLAITNKAHPMTNFGEITLIGDKDLADPRGYAKTKVYGADIYSPRYPQIEYKASPGAIRILNKRLEKYRQEGERAIYGGDELRRIDDLIQIKAFKRYADEVAGGDGAAKYHKMRELASELLRDAGVQERIFQGYTYSGNRRYVEHNLENVVKILKKELRGGEGFNYGVGSVRAKFTPEFKSIKAIKENQDRLMTKADFEKVKEEVDKDLFSLVEQLAPFHGASDRFGFADTVTNTLADAATMGLNRALKENGFANVPEDVAMEAAKYMTRLRNLPTEYFEAKILRSVDLSEFKGAVVPDNVSQETIAALESRGIKDIRRYKAGDSADRAAKIGEFEGLFFQNQQAPRGSYNPSQRTIALLEGANLSTYLHETGHWALDIYSKIAAKADAPEAIKADMDALLKWMGVDSLGKWNSMKIDEQRPHHEQLARGFEAYLMEGKAPTPELQGVFSRVRQWMVDIYQSLLNLNVKLSDEVRATFDRMLADDGMPERNVSGYQESAAARPSPTGAAKPDTPASAQGAASRTADSSGAVEPAQPAVSKALAVEGGDKAKIQSAVNRVEEIQATDPDMVVRAEADANGNVTERRTVSQELEQLRREAMDGTDTELGFADAELVRVAAECALSVGATA